MDDSISRQAAIDEIKGIYEWHDNVTKERIIEHFVRLPSVQPERPKGLWIETEEDLLDLKVNVKRCALCGATRPMKIFAKENYEFNFCPNCGADMKWKEHERD